MNKQCIYLKVEIGFDGRPPYKHLWKAEDPIEICNAETLFEEEKYIFQITTTQDINTVSYKTTGIFKVEISTKKLQAFANYENKSENICIQNLDSLVKSFLISDEKKYEELINLTRNAFKKFRWRFELYLVKNTETILNFFYSLDSEKWMAIVDCPSVTGLRVSVSNTPTDEKLIQRQATQFFKSDINEPVYIDMMREANLIRYPNYKSAFAIAMAALETATKEFIAKKIDKTRTLMYALPSPDVSKFFNTILPEIEPRIKLNKETEKKIKTIIQKRNELMHTGVVNVNQDDINAYITTINDLISLLDYFSGYDWIDIQHAKKLLENENF